MGAKTSHVLRGNKVTEIEGERDKERERERERERAIEQNAPCRVLLDRVSFPPKHLPAYSVFGSIPSSSRLYLEKVDREKERESEKKESAKEEKWESHATTNSLPFFPDRWKYNTSRWYFSNALYYIDLYLYEFLYLYFTSKPLEWGWGFVYVICVHSRLYETLCDSRFTIVYVRLVPMTCLIRPSI